MRDDQLRQQARVAAEGRRIPNLSDIDLDTDTEAEVCQKLTFPYSQSSPLINHSYSLLQVQMKRFRNGLRRRRHHCRRLLSHRYTLRPRHLLHPQR